MERLGPYALGMVHHADCLDALQAIPRGRLDAIVTDPPFGTTRNEWDRTVPWTAWFGCAWHALKPEAPIIALVDFETAYQMRQSEGHQRFRYEIVCPHNLPTGHLNAEKRPLVAHIFLIVLCREPPPYHPQKFVGPPVHRRRVVPRCAGTTYGAHAKSQADVSGMKWPTSVLPFDAVPHGAKEHSSEKPVELAEWILSSYTEPGAVVCDPFAGSGWVACAALRTGRRSLGFDSDPESVDLAGRRIAAEHERLGTVRPCDARSGQQVGLLTEDTRGR